MNKFSTSGPKTMMIRQPLDGGRLTLIFILLSGFMLRAYGCGYGLPWLFGVDEDYVMNPVLYQFFTRFDFNPHWFGAPDSFMMYTVAALVAIILIALAGFFILSGRVVGLDAFIDLVYHDRATKELLFSSSIVAGRLLMIAYATLTIYAVYRIGRKLFGQTAGLWAALFLAISPMHIDQSRIIRPDIPSTMLIAWSTYFLILYLENTGRCFFLRIAAFFSGVSMAAKWTSGMSLIPVFFVALACDWRKKPSDLRSLFKAKTIQTSLFFFLGFLVFAPFAVLNFATAYGDFILETLRPVAGHESFPFFQNCIWYIRIGLTKGFGGVLLALLAFIGLMRVLLSRQKFVRLLIFFPLVYFIMIGVSIFRWPRWIIPILPFEAVFAAVGVRALTVDWITGFKKPLARTVRVLFFGVLAWSVFHILAFDAHEAVKLTRQDQRILAKSWLETHLPQGAGVAYEAFGPPLEIKPREDLHLVNQSWSLVISWSISKYRREGIDYLVLNQEFRQNYRSEAMKYPRQNSRYDEIEKNAELVQSFENPEYPGPVLYIYHLR